MTDVLSWWSDSLCHDLDRAPSKYPRQTGFEEEKVVCMGKKDM